MPTPSHIHSTVRRFIGPCLLLYIYSLAHVALPELADPHAKQLQLHLVLRRGGKPPPCQAEDIPLRLCQNIRLTARYLSDYARHSR